MPKKLGEDEPLKPGGVALLDDDREEAVKPVERGRRDAVALAVDVRVAYNRRLPHKSVVYEGSTQTTPDPRFPEARCPHASDEIARVHPFGAVCPNERVLHLPGEDTEATLSYDFSRVDAYGRELGPERLLPDGRPYSVCRHIGHALRFLRERDEEGYVFEVLAKRGDRAKLEEFDRLLREQEAKEQDRGRPVLAAMNLLGR